jgi:kynurenine formamidase
MAALLEVVGPSVAGFLRSASLKTVGGQQRERTVRIVREPRTGLQFVELSHRWGYGAPPFPGQDDIKVHKIVNHAKHGVMTQIYKATMHVSTHVNAPLHLVPGGAGVGELDLQRFFGNGVVLSVPKAKWALIEADDLARATPPVQPDDIVVIVTGWHHKYADSKEYFGHAPGLSAGAARWLIERRVKMVAVDTAAVDHPLATSMGPHRNGPQIKYLLPEYQEATGRSAKQDFPQWNVAHKALLQAGIPTIENVGGDVDAVLGKRCTFHALPWRWPDGDACVVRFVAIHDPDGMYRIESGAGERG